MLTFSTLGPAQSNHAFVLDLYLQTYGLTGVVRTHFEHSFTRAADLVVEGAVDYLLQCSAHPLHAQIVGRYRDRMVPVDAFVADSQPMALMQARGARSHGVVAVQPATRQYADLSRFVRVEEFETVFAVQEALLGGRVDAGISFTSLVQENPHRFEILRDLGPVRDVWVLFARSTAHAAPAPDRRDATLAQAFAAARRTRPES